MIPHPSLCLSINSSLLVLARAVLWCLWPRALMNTRMPSTWLSIAVSNVVSLRLIQLQMLRNLWITQFPLLKCENNTYSLLKGQVGGCYEVMGNSTQDGITLCVCMCVGFFLKQKPPNHPNTPLPLELPAALARAGWLAVDSWIWCFSELTP